MVRMPFSVGGSVRAGNHHHIAIRVAQPAFPMIWAPVAIGRVAMAGQNYLDAHFGGALDDGIEIVDFKPEQYSVAVGLVLGIADAAVIMRHLEAMQLQDKLAVQDQLFVGGASMVAPAAEQTLIPPAARFHVGYRDQRLRTHFVSLAD